MAADLKHERRRGREAGERRLDAASTTTRASLARSARLEAVGRNIEKIVNAISLVVVQTSMLAVSGAVEAARAGEPGRGFAVVSNDIRSLAREASESAEQIKETVGGILDQIASLRRDLEQIVGSVEIEVQNNRTVLGAFEKVSRETAALEQRQRRDPAGRRADPGGRHRIGGRRAPDRQLPRRRRVPPPARPRRPRPSRRAAPRISPPPSRRSPRWPTRSSSRMAERFLTFAHRRRSSTRCRRGQVAEVIRLPAVARVPQAPKGLLGLANLRGTVLPVASLRGLLGVPKRGPTQAHARAIVLDGAAPVALAVDAVEALVTVDADQIETRQAELAAKPGERLKGAFAHDGWRGRRRQDPRHRRADRRGVRAAGTRPPAPVPLADLGGRETTADEAADDRQRLVSFEVAGQEYAFPLDVVLEVLDAPETLAALPAQRGAGARRDAISRHAAAAAVAARPAGLRAGRARRPREGRRHQGRRRARRTAGRPHAHDLPGRCRADREDPAGARGPRRRRSQDLRDLPRRERAPAGFPLVAGAAVPGGRHAAVEGGRQFRAGRPRRRPADRAAKNASSWCSGWATTSSACRSRRSTRSRACPSRSRGCPRRRNSSKAWSTCAAKCCRSSTSAGASTCRALEEQGGAPPGRGQHRAPPRGPDRRLRSPRCCAAPPTTSSRRPNLTNEAVRLVQGVINLEKAGRIVLLLDPAELLTRAERGLLDAFEAKAERARS